MSVKQICWAIALIWASLIIFRAAQIYHLPTVGGDDFQGYIVFNLSLEQGKLDEWWQMWDADIPLVSRVLYWIDFKLDEDMAVLFAINIATLLAIVFVWFLYLRRLGIAEFTPVAVLLTFNWVQITNIIQPFCGAAWFPNVLLPLIAFYCLATDRFKLALCSGVLSVGTMANGLLVLPLMAVMAWMIGLRWNRIALIIGVWPAIGAAYYFDWVSYPATGVAHLEPMTWNWEHIRYFAIAYPAGPFLHLMEYWSATDPVPPTLIAGGIFLFLATGLVIGWDYNKTEMALLCFLIFVIGTAAMTAIARHHYGTQYAAAPRYGMVQLAGWQALGTMLFLRIRPQLRQLFLGLAFAVLSFVFLPIQFNFRG